MTRGTPDGRILDSQFAAQVTDLGAVYSMLWGFAPVDGQGRVIYLDTFNNGAGGFDLLQTGAGIAPAIVTSPTVSMIYSPPNALRMNPGVVASDRSYVWRKQYMGTAARLGIEAVFDFSNTSPDYQITLDYNLTGSTSSKNGALKFSHATGLWQVFDNALGFQTIYNAGVPPVATRMWIQVKLVCDFSTGKYVRAFIGDMVFDCSQYSLNTFGTQTSGYDGYLLGEARAASYGAGTTPGVMGYFLMTRDEP